MVSTGLRGTRELFLEALRTDDDGLLSYAVSVGGCLESGILVYALLAGSVKCIEWLLEQGLNVNCFEGGVNNIVLGEYVVDIAEGKSHYAGVKVFLGKKGIGYTKDTIESGKDITPLILAAANENPACVDLLVKSGADVRYVDACGCSALMVAISQGRYETVKCLIEHGSDVNVKSKSGITPVMCACLMVGNVDTLVVCNIVKLLISRGACVNAQDVECDTALFMCLRIYREMDDILKSPVLNVVSILESLVRGGADVNAIGRGGTTVLMEICRYVGGDVEGLAMLLLDEGADVNVVCEDGMTPLMIAAKYSSASMIALLLNRGANVNACNFAGKSAIGLVDIFDNCNIKDSIIGDKYVKNLEKVKTLLAGGAMLRNCDLRCNDLQLAWRRTLELRFQLKYRCREVLRKELLNIHVGKWIEKVVWELGGDSRRRGLPRQLVEYVADIERFVVNML